MASGEMIIPGLQIKKGPDNSKTITVRPNQPANSIAELSEQIQGFLRQQRPKPLTRIELRFVCGRHCIREFAESHITQITPPIKRNLLSIASDLLADARTPNSSVPVLGNISSPLETIEFQIPGRN